MENDKPFSGQESLQVIQQMIFVAKKEQRNDGLGWIWWGWMLFAASIFSLLNDQYNWLSPYFFWDTLGVIAIGYFIIRSVGYFSGKRRKAVRTYTGELIHKLNVGFFVSLFFIMIAMNTVLGPLAGFPILVNLYGFWILVYGTAMNFRPFIIGAFFAWSMGIAGLFVKTYEAVLLIHALAVLGGYIIPGHIANYTFRKLSREVSNYSV
jgi:hypothetical protein